MSDNKNKLIVALDVPTFEEARALVEAIGDAVQIYKVGSQLFTACGPIVVRHLLAQGKDVFLDLKFHDIPNTVANAVSSVVGLNNLGHEAMDENGKKTGKKGCIILCTLHTIGGSEMLERAVQAAIKTSADIGVTKPRLVGITVLTSEATSDNISDIVLERARVAKASGLDGVVASSQEASILRREFGEDFVVVTPGIRPAGADQGDQKRVTTPKEAIANGSSYLVVGRPIVKADNPNQAAIDILKEINEE